MGLFSFLKDAGSKLFNREAVNAAPAADPAAEAARIQAMKDAKINELVNVIAGLGLRIDNGRLDVNDAGDTITVYGDCHSQADKEKVILAIGNTHGVAYVDDQMTVSNPEPEADFYEVKKGDSLSKIAKHFYGDMMKYPLIFEANKPMLRDVDEIYPGQTLRVPKLG